MVFSRCRTDRLLPSSGLLPLAVLAPLTAVAAAGLATASGTMRLIGFGALAGVAAPPIVASIRPLWARTVSQDLVHSAYALKAVLTEVTKICGPLLTAAAAAHSPRLGVITAGVLLVTGTCLVGFHPPTTDRPSTMWMVAAEELGIAAGTVGAGALTQHMGAWPALLSAAVGGGLGALVIAARKTCLASSGKPPAAAPETP